MSNVHTLSDLNNNNNPGPMYGQLGNQQQRMGMGPQDEESKQAAGLYGGLTGGGGNIGKPPREETYWDMWKSTFCPTFSPISFTFGVWLINTAVYLATLIMMVNPKKSLNEFVFLGPDLRTLHNWGALDAYEVRYNFQVWRLFTSLFLSVGFSTYMISSGALMILGFMIENPKMSAAKMAIFYIGCGVLGNLFGAATQSECSVGNMPAVMAMTSGLLASMIVNWKNLAGAGMLRICLIAMSVFLFVILLLLSSQPDAGWAWVSISLPAEAGGYMAGLGLGMMLMPHAVQRDSPYVKMIRKIGAALTFVYCVILIPVFFTAVDPSPTKWAN